MDKYISKLLVRKLVKLIIREHEKGLSYRAMARLSKSPYVKPGTMCRIAKSKGEWIPKSEKILAGLGVLVYRPKRHKSLFDISSKELLWRLNHR